jgi:hypothetical protein
MDLRHDLAPFASMRAGAPNAVPLSRQRPRVSADDADTTLESHGGCKQRALKRHRGRSAQRVCHGRRFLEKERKTMPKDKTPLSPEKDYQRLNPGAGGPPSQAQERARPAPRTTADEGGAAIPGSQNKDLKNRLPGAAPR